MMGTNPNLAMVEVVANHLGRLKSRVVFLGGAATGLLLTDPAAAQIRPTKDVDVIVQVGSRMEYRALEKELLELGFRQDRSEGAPLCRWVIEGVLVDVMPTDPALLGFSNRWYPEAMEEAMAFTLPGGTEIRLVSAPYFLATKLEAFLGRGEEDFMASHDLEDVVTLIDGRPGVVEEVLGANPDLRKYIAETLNRFLQDDSFIGSIQGSLLPDRASQARFPLLLERFRAISRLPQQ